MQKLAVPTDVAAMIALIIAKQLVAVTVAVATIAKTVVVKPRLYIMNGFLGISSKVTNVIIFIVFFLNYLLLEN